MVCDKIDYIMSDDECELFNELSDYSKELKEDRDHYGYPYNEHNPRYNLNLVSSETLDELVQDMLMVLTHALEYKKQGWELTEPVRFGKIQLHYNEDGSPYRGEEDNE